MERCWILLGMMGAGKSSVGRALAELSGRAFEDTDLMLQHRFGRPVSQIFKVYGEQTFRDHETSILRGLQPGPVVLATGGGIVLRQENWTELRRLGITIYLRASAETLIERLQRSKKKRPLLDFEDWEERTRNILGSRLALYEQADVTFDVDSIELSEVAPRLFQQLRGLGA